MRKDRNISFLLALGYILLSLALYLGTEYIDKGTELMIVDVFLLPLHLAIVMGIMGGSSVTVLIFPIVLLLLCWLLFFIVIKLIKLIKRLFSTKSSST